MTGASERQRVRALIERAGVAVMMNVDEDGHPVGRPMLPLFLAGDPHIYFLTNQNSRKVAQLVARPQVALAIVGAKSFFVVSGPASASQDPGLIRRLWKPSYRAWFPDGTDDRAATVLRIVVERVEYWEPPRTPLIRLMRAAKAVLTRRPVETPRKTLDGL